MNHFSWICGIHAQVVTTDVPGPML
jgi:hypothetical protein